jgi:hypothetical protein
MIRNDEKDNLQKLQQDWKQLDEIGENKPTTIADIKEQVMVYQTKQKYVFYKELTIFLFTAVLIMTVFVMSITHAPILFITIQFGAILLAPIILYVLSKRKKREEKVFL